MLARAGVFVSLLAAAFAAAGPAAASGRLLVRPGVPLAGGSATAAAPARRPRPATLLVQPDVPIVGERATIELEVSGPRLSSALVLELASPTGVPVRLRLERVAQHEWMTAYHFPDDGPWKLRVQSGGVAVSGLVTVLQNGAVAPAPRALPSAGASDLLGGGSLAFVPRFP